MRTLPATNYFNGARGTVAVLTNITDLRHANEQVTQNIDACRPRKRRSASSAIAST